MPFERRQMQRSVPVRIRIKLGPIGQQLLSNGKIAPDVTQRRKYNGKYSSFPSNSLLRTEKRRSEVVSNEDSSLTLHLLRFLYERFGATGYRQQTLLYGAE
jgi:hypothetical protein